MAVRRGVLFGRGSGQEVDDGYDREAHVLDSMGVPWVEVDLEEVLDGGGSEALRHLPRSRGWSWLYRGWLLNPEDVTTLWEAVLDRGDRLVVQPSEVAAAAVLPEWAPVLGGLTPSVLGPPPWFVRDHLKSARQWWARAAFVPAGADREAFSRVCAGLRSFMEGRFYGGFVVRRFVDLAPLPFVAQGHPVFDEHRVIYWRGRPIGWAPYHDVDDVEPLERVPFPDLGRRVASPFFVADLGRLADGGWTVIELNDGGSSRFPDQLDPWEVYGRIFPG
ncbi:MAG: ATP-grasp domain-containing protein [Myxococcales bacterium]|nr:ATP-grasp domain-containing protein [Myxococcales bacterium]